MEILFERFQSFIDIPEKLIAFLVPGFDIIVAIVSIISISISVSVRASIWISIIIVRIARQSLIFISGGELITHDKWLILLIIIINSSSRVILVRCYWCWIVPHT